MSYSYKSSVKSSWAKWLMATVFFSMSKVRQLGLGVLDGTSIGCLRRDVHSDIGARSGQILQLPSPGGNKKKRRP
jgi:hypothetical protein